MILQQRYSLALQISGLNGYSVPSIHQTSVGTTIIFDCAGAESMHSPSNGQYCVICASCRSEDHFVVQRSTFAEEVAVAALPPRRCHDRSTTSKTLTQHCNGPRFTNFYSIH